MIKVNITYGHIAIPVGVDRGEFVKTCYKRERVSVVLENGQGVMYDCYIDKQTLRDIYFPKTPTELGSYVCILQQRGRAGVIVGVIGYENESQLFQEGDIRLIKSDSEGNEVGVNGNVSKGELQIGVTSASNPAILNILAHGKDNMGEINIKTNSKVSIRTENEVNIESFGEVSVKSLSKTEVGKFTEFKVSDEKIVCGEGSEPVLLGTETKSQLQRMSERIDGIINALNNGVPSAGTPDSGAALIVSIKAGLTPLSANKESFDAIESELTFTD